MRTIVIEDLSAAEKLELIGELWESLEPEEVPLTPAQTEEIDRRLAAAEDETGAPWDEVEARLRRRLR
jgi:putative addiction module component (TIGR02574 family)